MEADPIADAAQASFTAPAAAAQIEMIIAAERPIRDIGILLRQDKCSDGHRHLSASTGCRKADIAERDYNVRFVP